MQHLPETQKLTSPARRRWRLHRFLSLRIPADGHLADFVVRRTLERTRFFAKKADHSEDFGERIEENVGCS